MSLPEEKKGSAGRATENSPQSQIIRGSAWERFKYNSVVVPFLGFIIFFPVVVLMAFPTPLILAFLATLLTGLLLRGPYLLARRALGKDYGSLVKIWREHVFQFIALVCLYTFSRGLGDFLWWLKSGQLYFGFDVNAYFVYPYIFLGPFCIIVPGCYSILDFIWRSRHIRQLENLPSSKIHSAALGLVELKGRAGHYGDASNPFILSSSGVKPFYLEDDTGKVLVDPAGAEVRGNFYWFDAIINTAFAMRGMLGLREVVLRRRGIPTQWGNEGISIDTWHHVVEEGDPLYVIGNLEINRDPSNKGEERRIVRAKDVNRLKTKDAFLELLFGDLDYTNVFFITDSDEITAKSLMKAGRGISLAIGISSFIAGLFVLWEGIWGLGKL